MRGAGANYEFFSKSRLFDAIGESVQLPAASQCELSPDQLAAVSFPAYVKFDFGVSATGGRGGDCLQHMSVMHDRADLLDKLPFFCTPAMDKFKRYGHAPESARCPNQQHHHKFFNFNNYK